MTALLLSDERVFRQMAESLRKGDWSSLPWAYPESWAAGRGDALLRCLSPKVGDFSLLALDQVQRLLMAGRPLPDGVTEAITEAIGAPPIDPSSGLRSSTGLLLQRIDLGDTTPPAPTHIPTKDLGMDPQVMEQEQANIKDELKRVDGLLRKLEPRARAAAAARERMLRAQREHEALVKSKPDAPDDIEEQRVALGHEIHAEYGKHHNQVQLLATLSEQMTKLGEKRNAIIRDIKGCKSTHFATRKVYDLLEGQGCPVCPLDKHTCTAGWAERKDALGADLQSADEEWFALDSDIADVDIDIAAKQAEVEAIEEDGYLDRQAKFRVLQGMNKKLKAYTDWKLRADEAVATIEKCKVDLRRFGETDQYEALLASKDMLNMQLVLASRAVAHRQLARKRNDTIRSRQAMRERRREQTVTDPVRARELLDVISAGWWGILAPHADKIMGNARRLLKGTGVTIDVVQSTTAGWAQRIGRSDDRVPDAAMRNLARAGLQVGLWMYVAAGNATPILSLPDVPLKRLPRVLSNIKELHDCKDIAGALVQVKKTFRPERPTSWEVVSDGSSERSSHRERSHQETHGTASPR